MSNFGGAGQAEGIEIWRIENFEAKRMDKSTYGKFYSGDCYIVLQTYKDKFGKLAQNLFYLLGKASSQDEQGTVAYKAVELDDSLGGKPVQYREVEDALSPAFQSIFPSLQFLEGGVASGFKKVERDKYDPRLFHLKGKRHVQSTQVPLSADSLNQGDVFILDLGLKIYQWNGKDANKYEKAKGLDLTTKIRNDERGGRAEVIVLESGADSNDEFWAALGGKKSVKSAAQGGSDDEVKESVVQLFQLSDAGATAVASGLLEKSMLDTSSCYIVDSGSAVYVWVGKNASKDARPKAMQLGQQYLTQHGRPANTPLSRVVEHSESPQFKALFKVWNPPVKVDFNEPAAKVEKPADFSGLYQRTKAAEEKMVDNATGKLTIWRIENFDKVPLDPSMYGQFFAGDSYIILYEYKVGTRDMAIIYFWQGRESSQDEKGASAVLTVKLASELRCKATQVRVVQNKEPNHFLLLFKGKMVVHSGGKASAFKNRADADSQSAGVVALYHVRGSTDVNTRAVQVEAAAASLNSGDCFVLLNPSHAFAWCGKGSTDSEKKVAGNVASLLKGGRSVVTVAEGNESDEFWGSLGGQGAYSSSKELESVDFEPRLFVLSNKSGQIKVEEVFNFSQDDLLNDDVMILDAHSEVYVWVGNDSNDAEKAGAQQAALDYVKNAPDGRDPDTPVFQVAAGSEPPSFTCHFLAWDSNKASDFSDPYAKKLAATKGASGGAAKTEAKAAPAAAPVRLTAVSSNFVDPATHKFPHAELKAGCPAGVDPKRKEEYLNAAEFQAAFGCTLAEFAAQPAWKKEATKKKAGLF